jgi:hypothetical protein
VSQLRHCRQTHEPAARDRAAANAKRLLTIAELNSTNPKLLMIRGSERRLACGNDGI